ncbi:glycosyltransferase family 4 protein [Paraburkholderia unamae]|uniref:Glycosyltransferase involved in cell wall biosynthesis n=1 Tax=Paraburkholderia unamae TaxID=219649 RepID=A0ABX5KLU5_9BURK|nr:glycosyltransferase family 4 protein [Paraburkholderia unamae]PVX77965.1 glycosyltransferase involved in cell wall biosynthesis [Paraburkholderia unamae]RAR58890.1 glycosyltransferase involved in cell wall biosynthesis [Paraburkholderia unamae]
MKITVFVNSMGSGGAERVAATLANAWSERGHDVTLIATFTGRGSCFYSLSDKIEFIYLADVIESTARGPVSYVKRILSIRKLIRERNVDIVVSLLTNVNMVVIAALQGTGVPIIACEHSNPIADGRRPFWNWMGRFFYPKASVVTVLTEGVVEQFRTILGGAKNIMVVPNPLPAGLERDSVHTDKEKVDSHVIGVGRLQPLKRFDMLIRSFAKIVSEFPEWKLVIIGEGPDRKRLECQIAELGLTERIFLPGKTTDPWSSMRRASLFALTSKYEGLPMAMMEAMALGVPVVAVDCPSGPRELTEGGVVGSLVGHSDEDAYAQALADLMRAGALREELGRRGADSIRRRYSIDAVMKIWDRVFKVAIESRKYGRDAHQ